MTYPVTYRAEAWVRAESGVPEWREVVAFESYASDLVSTDTNICYEDVFVRRPADGDDQPGQRQPQRRR